MTTLASGFRRFALPIATACAALAACGQPADTGSPAAEAGPAPGPSQGVTTAPDGARIAWWRQGSGDTALVFVHGWSCDREFWREQVDAFIDDYTVVTLDLPGHGASGGDRDPWRVVDYGGDVVAVTEALQLDRVVLVGHSMGGLVALEAAALLGDRALAVVAADALHDAEIRYTDALAEPMLTAFRDDYTAAIAGMFGGMNGSAMPGALGQWVIDKALASRPEVGVALLEDYTTIATSAWFERAGVPVRAINAAAGGFTPETRVESNRQYADYDAIILDGVGHFLQLEAPERFNGALRQVLADIDAG